MNLRMLGMKSKRDVRCAGVAALVAVLMLQLMVVPATALGLWHSPAAYDTDLVQALSIALLKITVVHLIFPGIPIFLWLYHRNRLSWSTVIGTCYIVGMLAGLFWVLRETPVPEYTQILLRVGRGGSHGFAVGLAFWVVWCLQKRLKILS
ncbi:hypothetical protein NFC81_10795 [Salinispirillum sp. LH 10-3-1]|uniref:Uncharacterized protein n=1 Tax=Salinispirillum sp. LH 10-3-1 TaxID=2952525 RepID=A0AB38YCY9_9GAMM